MSINVNNFNTKIIKPDPQKQVKNSSDGEKLVSKFEESLNNSIQTNIELISPTKTSSKNIMDIVDTQINFEISKDDLDILCGMLYLLNMICINNNQPNALTQEQNLFDLQNNLDLIDNINYRTDDSELFKINMNEEVLDKVLLRINFDKMSITSKNITLGDVLNKISENHTIFKDLLKEGFDKIGGSETLSKILENMDLPKMLNNEQVLNNVRNELATKLNVELRPKQEDSDIEIELPRNENLLNSSVKDIENFNSVSKIKNSSSFSENETMSREKNQNFTKETDILKEISGEVNPNRGVENYFADNLKVNDVPRNIIYRTIDARDPIKFAKDFIDNIEYMSTNNKVEMVVKLNPDQLGKMDIKYEFSKETVKIMIRVEKTEVLKILDNTVTDIKNMIRENHQINMENIHVDFQQFEFNSDGQNQRRGNFTQDRNNGNNTIKLENEEITKEDKGDFKTGILV